MHTKFRSCFPSGMPRLRLRRLLLTLVALAGATVLLVNLRLRDSLLQLNGDDTPDLPQANQIAIVEHKKTEEPSTQLPEKIPGPPKYWFMKDGTLRPEPLADGANADLWPEDAPSSDRIVQQLMYVPPASAGELPVKSIVLYFGKGGWNDLPMGRAVFQRDNCPVSACQLTTDTKRASTADAIFFKDRFTWPKYKKPYHQVWIQFLLECPLHTQGFTGLGPVFNWTATYRHDSDIVAPYEKYVSYPGGEQMVTTKNYARGKSKMVAWFVSNCAARNRRSHYARELGKHIEVDVFGSCGPKRCPRNRAGECFKMLDKDYRFYLAFENSNCKDYVTEKFFVNGLSRDVIPIVMGARREDYERSAPPLSFIHVEDFASPEELARFLHLLAKNETLYNAYFYWKGKGEFVNTYFWCRICALLHAPPSSRSGPNDSSVSKVYEDMHSWWAGPGTCVADRWTTDNRPDHFDASTKYGSATGG